MPEHVHLLLSEPERAPLAAITALLTPEGEGRLGATSLNHDANRQAPPRRETVLFPALENRCSPLRQCGFPSPRRDGPPSTSPSTHRRGISPMETRPRASWMKA